MKISIITIALNNVSGIKRTIESVISQSYSNIDYVVIDGRSTDGTLKIIDRYKDYINQFVSEKDDGIYDAMNKGINLSTGDAIGFLNAEDYYIDHNVIKKVVAMFQKYKTDSCYGDIVFYQKKTGAISRKWISRPYEKGLFKTGFHLPHPAIFIKRKMFDKYGVFDKHFDIAADYELMLRFFEKYHISSCYLPEVFVKMMAGGVSNKSIFNIVKANIQCYKAWKKNELRVSPLIMLRKPLSKIKQYL